MGGAISGLSCLIKDDRWKPVEIIRKNDLMEESRNGLIDKRFSLQDHSAKKNTDRVGDYLDPQILHITKPQSRYHKTSSTFRPTT